MRTLFASLSLLLASACHAATARSGLLLMEQGDHAVVFHVADSKLQEVMRLGLPVNYGESRDAFVFLSNRRQQTGTWVAEIVDKKTYAVLWSHPVSGVPLVMKPGPADNVVLTPTAIYFVTYRFMPDDSGLTRNSLGGVFDLNALSRKDGQQFTFPLPEGVGYLHADAAGVPVLRAPGGKSVLRFDEATNSLRPAKDTSGVERLAHADSSHVSREFHATSGGKPAVGFVRLTGERQVSLAYVDPAKKTVLWEKVLPADVAPESVFAAPDGWDYFINYRSGAVTGISGEAGTRELWKLPTDYLYGARILSIDDDGQR